MARVPAIGYTEFDEIMENNCFYVDKTGFIKEWWESQDKVTLITRPRRFGKTLTMRMVEQFFSVAYAGRGDLFEGLSIWNHEQFRKLQGTYPVISVSFLNIKGDCFDETYSKIRTLFMNVFRRAEFLMDSDIFSPRDRDYFFSFADGNADRGQLTTALGFLSEVMCRYYGKKVILLIDEYDTPMNTAYVSGYWDELVKLFRELFTGGLKANQYLERALLTGITRISKESFFSELNNLEVVSVTSNRYETAIGFTEDEVLSALKEFGLGDTMDDVRYWYDGFRFGNCSSIYNPWSIIHYLGKHKFAPYWVNTGSNDLISVLVRRGSESVKMILEDLLNGKSFKAMINEQIVFSQLSKDKNTIWSLLLASGYLKTLSIDDEMYELALTNHEARLSFRMMVRDWFSRENDYYNNFVNALLCGDVDKMNRYMNTVIANVISSFDSGTKPAEKHPERFYHGLVLGLIVALEGRYIITSNRESGDGRYDVSLEPLHAEDDGIILEFKVQDSEKEANLQDTVTSALQQIMDKNYVAELAKKVRRDNIRIYGFAFAGKKVLIGGGYKSSAESFTRSRL